jgi:hypothetical protein
MEMIPPHNDSIWPDDTKRAAVTLALAAATNSDMQFRDVIDAIKEALDSGRSLQLRLTCNTSSIRPTHIGKQSWCAFC